jgi:hypothetical protein
MSASLTPAGDTAPAHVRVETSSGTVQAVCTVCFPILLQLLQLLLLLLLLLGSLFNTDFLLSANMHMDTPSPNAHLLPTAHHTINVK